MKYLFMNLLLDDKLTLVVSFMKSSGDTWIHTSPIDHI